MGKRVLLFTIIIAVSVISLLLGSTLASAVDEGDRILIKGNGPYTCETTESESCGTGEMRSKFHLVVQDVGKDTVSGIAKGTVQVEGVTASGSNSPALKLNFKNLQWEFNKNIKQLTVLGDAEDKDGNIVSLDVTGDNFVSQGNGKFIMDLNIELTGPDEQFESIIEWRVNRNNILL